MNQTASMNRGIQLEDILIAYRELKEIVLHTPLQKNQRLSEKYECNVYLKREDLQHVRSFKLRGAYYKMKSLTGEETKNGVVCASAGNHAQGVAFSCSQLGIHGKIYMPATTPRQKVDQVQLFGRDNVEIILIGDTFDDAFAKAMECCEKEERSFIHPFDDEKVIAGQGTTAGLSSYFKSVSPKTKCIGVEPLGAASMKYSFDEGKVSELESIDTFVDGAAVKCVGQMTYQLCKENLEDIVVVPSGQICTTILDLYNQHAIVAEPAGAISVAALDLYKEQIKGKTVVCMVSGGNNDIGRMQEIKEKSLLYEGLLYYFIVNFPQRAGALREFLDEVLGPNDDISRFEYTKKNNKESGPALVGVELKDKNDYEGLILRMNKKGFSFVEVNKDSNLFHLLI
ncbi:threonine ammonia-lyase [Peribacillus simplex]|uniref:threonine ammonia-lyase n=1 Tax=Peribacillus simplex TaxID=1478 RepID=UPI003D2A22C5